MARWPFWLNWPMRRPLTSRAKCKREGLSIRTVTLTVWKQWTAQERQHE